MTTFSFWKTMKITEMHPIYFRNTGDVQKPKVEDVVIPIKPIISNDINKSQGINEFEMFKIIKLNTKIGGTKFAGSASDI